MENGAAHERSGSYRLIIQRPRLLELLNESESRVMLLVAPAGYGKTTLARQWLAGQKQRHAWYQATATSSDPAALALGIASSAATLVPEVGERLRARLKTSANPAAEAESLAADLANDLASWPDRARLFIDDYHLLAESEAAEKFIESFIAATEFPLLISSRTRPSWVTAKNLLYGEVIEFGRNVLAMTPGEAADVLSQAHEDMPGLVALAEGWPAVIGLAALLSAPLPTEGGEVPETLHEYFAEELFNGLDSDLRRNLVQLSLAPSINETLSQALFGNRGLRVLEEGDRSGFLTRATGCYEMHPLLRQFLRTKLGAFDRTDAEKTARLIATSYADESRWDDAAAVAAEFGLTDVLLRTLEEALNSVLSEGRLTTLNRWLENARALAPTAPVVRLAAIEVAFRSDGWIAAGSRASQLARSIGADEPLASRIYLLAGQIAHLDNRQEDALELFTAAKAAARSPFDLRRSLWSRFVTLTDLESRGEAAKALCELEELPPLSAEDLLRASQGRLQVALRWGGITEALDGVAGALELVDQSTDPIVRTGFLQTYGSALCLSARYHDASEIAQRQIAEAQRSSLEWVLPHALEMRAIADFGLREFDRALKTLSEALRLATEQGNLHTQMNAVVLTARVHLCRGSPSRALKTLDSREARFTSPGMEGENLATQGFAMVCSGRIAEAQQLLKASEEVTSHLEARVLRRFATAVASSFQQEDQTVDLHLLTAALAEAHETGNFDAFVYAYRSFPSLLQRLPDVTELDTTPLISLVQSLDPPLAELAGVGLPSANARTSTDLLTQREEQVLDLVRQGLTNREIARTLWIAESTVKAHIHHVLQKLGARSRTEAVALTRTDL